MNASRSKVSLGCGLIGIGRPWGFVPTGVPTEAEAYEFLEHAYGLGIRYFDTAPSYALSEARLGNFLGSLTREEREDVVVATKFGESWDQATQVAVGNHTLEGLLRSLDKSLEVLGNIDVLQIHKTTPEILRSNAIPKAWDYAAAAGIPEFGASIKDMESARIVCHDLIYSVIQLPYNSENSAFSSAVHLATEHATFVLVNRPLNMGRLAVSGGANRHQQLVAAFRFILALGFEGVILTGTKSIQHLDENWRAFREALELEVQ